MSRRKARLDHIRPLARGGIDHACNLALVCHGCNTRKSAASPGELLLWALRIVFAAILADVRGLARLPDFRFTRKASFDPVEGDARTEVA
jgi:hypothetical protein